MSLPTDPLQLAQALMRCRSVTPADGGAQLVLAAELERLGFKVTRLRFGNIDNLFAERGSTDQIFALPAIPMWCRPVPPKNGATTRSAGLSRTAFYTAAAPAT